uniref:Uncharacterized protein n=1 Tax=Moniliophthora roreri TaxID=221103 RepID=A0A0W0FJP0_MONRR
MAFASQFLLFFLVSSSYSQIISNSPVPPLQWINLTGALSGTSKPPPLKDAFIAFHQPSRTVLIFGGISPSGLLSAETYLLSLDSLSWSKPSPPANLQQTPSARSVVGSISGPDVAANSRNAFMVYGGQDANGEELSDAWEFDFISQFWSPLQTTSEGPGAKSAVGGIDIRSQPFSDPSNGLVNAFHLLVSDSSNSALWRFNISGTLSSNLPDSAKGTWDSTGLTNVPAFSEDEAGSAVIGSKLAVIGGCTNPTDTSCAFIVEADPGGRASVINVPACAAPRHGARVVPNLNKFASGFSAQVFLLLGTLEANWDDNNGLGRGEVAVLDTNAGTWSRVIPSGDPDGGQAAVPVPRQGAAIAAMESTATARTSTDTIVFGGRDASGQYLNDVWLLRAYSGVATPSSPNWSGFGDGKLQSGINANGAGVSMQFITQCASLSSNSSSQSPTATSTNAPVPTASQPSQPDPDSNSLQKFDTSIHHKVLSPVSVVVALFPLLLLRYSPQTGKRPQEYQMAFVYAAGLILFVAYSLGVAGLATSFTSLSISAPFQKRSSSASSSFLQTTHGKVGFAFFIVLYGVVPLLSLTVCLRRRSVRSSSTDVVPLTADIEDKSVNRAFSPSHSPSPPPSSPRMRSQSLGPSSAVYRPSQDRTDENDTLSMSSSGAQRTFQVLNRPTRVRRHIEVYQILTGFNDGVVRAIRAQEAPSTPGTMDALMGPSDPVESPRQTKFPSTILEVTTRMMLQISLCGLCVISLIALWSRASKAFFAVFLAWTLLYYAILILLAWKGRPTTSILSTVISRLRSTPQPPIHERSSHTATPTPLATTSGYPFPASGSSTSPYIHHNPPHHTVPSSLGQDDVFSYTGPRSMETADHEDDEDEDEYTRQQRIESEMERREVSIVTVPKRKLWVANPS